MSSLISHKNAEICWAKFKKFYWPAAITYECQYMSAVLVTFLDSPDSHHFVYLSDVQKFDDDKCSREVWKDYNENDVFRGLKVHYKKYVYLAKEYLHLRSLKLVNYDPVVYFSYLKEKETKERKHRENPPDAIAQMHLRHKFKQTPAYRILQRKARKGYENLRYTDIDKAEYMVACVEGKHVDEHIRGVVSGEIPSIYIDLFDQYRRIDDYRVLVDSNPSALIKEPELHMPIYRYLEANFSDVIKALGRNGDNYIAAVLYPEAVDKAATLIQKQKFEKTKLAIGSGCFPPDYHRPYY